jgi:hypothetical protein
VALTFTDIGRGRFSYGALGMFAEFPAATPTAGKRRPDSDLTVRNRTSWRRAHFWMMRLLYLTRVTLSTTFRDRNKKLRPLMRQFDAHRDRTRREHGRPIASLDRPAIASLRGVQCGFLRPATSCPIRSRTGGGLPRPFLDDAPSVPDSCNAVNYVLRTHTEQSCISPPPRKKFGRQTRPSARPERIQHNGTRRDRRTTVWRSRSPHHVGRGSQATVPRRDGNVGIW